MTYLDKPTFVLQVIRPFVRRFNPSDDEPYDSEYAANTFVSGSGYGRTSTPHFTFAAKHKTLKQANEWFNELEQGRHDELDDDETLTLLAPDKTTVLTSLDQYVTIVEVRPAVVTVHPRL